MSVMDSIVHRTGEKAEADRKKLLFWITGGKQISINNGPSLKGCTRSELSGYTGLRINVVCARVDELIKAGLIKKGGSRRCTVTHQTVQYLVEVVKDALPAE